MSIQFECPSSQQLGGLRTIRVSANDLPRLLPAGLKCQLMSVSPNRLKAGDIVATPEGKFRRFWATDGRHCWVTDASGLTHEVYQLKDGTVQKVLVDPGLWQNLVWYVGAMAGRMRRKTQV